jgi:hypothetical protein
VRKERGSRCVAGVDDAQTAAAQGRAMAAPTNDAVTVTGEGAPFCS